MHQGEPTLIADQCNFKAKYLQNGEKNKIKKGSSLLCSAVVSHDVTRFRVRAAISIRLDSAVFGSRAKYTLPEKSTSISF